LPSDGAAGDKFGGGVAISGDTALVGASENNDKGGNSGSVYVFEYNGSAWVETDNLLASDGGSADHFGYRISLSGDALLVGANLDRNNGYESGSAYIFRYDGSTWVEESKLLLPSDGAVGDFFGSSVSISGGTILVGAYRDDDNVSNSGSAYVFDLE